MSHTLIPLQNLSFNYIVDLSLIKKYPFFLPQAETIVVVLVFKVPLRKDFSSLPRSHGTAWGVVYIFMPQFGQSPHIVHYDGIYAARLYERLPSKKMMFRVHTFLHTMLFPKRI